MYYDKEKGFYMQVSGEDVNEAKKVALQRVETYRRVYDDPASTKDDLRNAANEAIRAWAKTCDLQTDLIEALKDMGNMIADEVLQAERKPKGNMGVN